MYLWAHPQQTACGCYLLPLDATAADLSMSSSSLADALAEFTRRGLVDLDHATGEILLPDWFRFYTPRTAAARGAVESAIRKILSTELSKKAEKAYKSTALGWKGKEKEKGKASSEEEERSGAKARPSHAAIKAAENRAKLPQRSHAGIRCWTTEDMVEARAIEGKYGLDRVTLIVKEFESKRVEPLPSRVSRAIQEQTALPAGKWWASEESTIATATQVNIHPYPGESMEAFKQRIHLRLAQLDGSREARQGSTEHFATA
ncbi:hypothetical protein D8I24_2097 [Cupriavidus necator H850]|nr:hypothetical protein D8I24_2097 [Cupriavidus necator H850]